MRPHKFIIHLATSWSSSARDTDCHSVILSQSISVAGYGLPTFGHLNLPFRFRPALIVYHRLHILHLHVKQKQSLLFCFGLVYFLAIILIIQILSSKYCLVDRFVCVYRSLTLRSLFVCVSPAQAPQKDLPTDPPPGLKVARCKSAYCPPSPQVNGTRLAI